MLKSRAISGREESHVWAALADREWQQTRHMVAHEAHMHRGSTCGGCAGVEGAAHRVARQLNVDHQQRRYLLICRQVRLVRHIWRRRQHHVLRDVTQLEIKCVQVRSYKPARMQARVGKVVKVASIAQTSADARAIGRLEEDALIDCALRALLLLRLHILQASDHERLCCSIAGSRNGYLL